MRDRTTRALLVAVLLVSTAALVGCGGFTGANHAEKTDFTCADDAASLQAAFVESEDETCAYFLDFSGGKGDAADDDDEPEATAALYEEEPRQRLVYLNRHGGTFQQAKRNNSARDESTLVTGTTEIPAYKGDDEDWRELVSCVERRFARFDLALTDKDPGDSPHIEAVIGGHPCQLGLHDRVRGVAPLANNCGVVERAVVYAFAHNIKDVTTTCEVTAHEIGHALGLDHEYLCDDPMTYLSCGHRSFQDTDARCGTTEARDCACSERQNTVQHLSAVLGEREGADTEPPAVRVVSPEPDASVPGDGSIDIDIEADDNDDIAAVKLVWESDKTYTVDCASPIGNVTCKDRGAGRYTFRLRAGTGERNFRVRAIDNSGNVAATEKQRLELEAGEAPVVMKAEAGKAL